jgi:hypothetical protein
MLPLRGGNIQDFPEGNYIIEEANGLGYRHPPTEPSPERAVQEYSPSYTSLEAN